MYPSRRIVPSHQAHGYAGSAAGFSGRLGSGNAGGAGRGDRNTTTPTRAHNSGTTFNVGNIVMLLTDCGPNFPRNTLVEITAIEEAPVSTRKGTVQGVEWLGTDEDSLYRFGRKYARQHETTITSVETVDPVSHYNLAPGPGQAYDIEQYPEDSVLCTLKDTPFFLPNDQNHPIRVPRHTYCKVAALTTRKSGRKGARALRHNKKLIDRCFYILEAKYVTYALDFEVCIRKKEVFNFRAATEEECRRYNNPAVPAQGTVVNWH